MRHTQQQPIILLLLLLLACMLVVIIFAPFSFSYHQPAKHTNKNYMLFPGSLPYFGNFFFQLMAISVCAYVCVAYHRKKACNTLEYYFLLKKYKRKQHQGKPLLLLVPRASREVVLKIKKDIEIECILYPGGHLPYMQVVYMFVWLYQKGLMFCV